MKKRIEIVYNNKVDVINRFTLEQKLSGIFVNGSVFFKKKIEVEKNTIYTFNDIPVIFYAENFETSLLRDKSLFNDYIKTYKKVELSSNDCIYIEYAHNLLELHYDVFSKDILTFTKNNKKTKIRVLGDPKLLVFDDNVLISDCNVFDTRKGPIVIGKNSQIIGPSLIQGPTFIGENTLIDSGKVRESFIGNTCKISGEVEASIFLDFTNKHHEGFVGHSYIGSFVNFGALTTVSDLKNNYSFIKVFIDDQFVRTSQIKLGVFIGDYTRLGIGTLLNSGTVVGSFSNIFGGGMVPKFIPPFSWGKSYPFQKYEINRLKKDISIIAARRDKKIDEDYLCFIDKLYKEVSDEKYKNFV